MNPDFQKMLDASPNVLTFIAAGLMVTFTLSYFLLFQVRLTPTGRAFGFFVASLTSVLLLSVLFILFGANYPFRWLARDVVLLAILGGIGNFMRVMFIKWRDPTPIVLTPKPRKTKQGDR